MDETTHVEPPDTRALQGYADLVLKVSMQQLREFLVDSRGRTLLSGPEGSGDGALSEYVPKPSTSGAGSTVAEVFEVSDDDDEVVQPNRLISAEPAVSKRRTKVTKKRKPTQ